VVVAVEDDGAPVPGEKVVSNLVANAILHNRRGGEVRVALGRDGDSALLVVADNGPGIPPADLPRVFERFYRADTARSGANAGTGLGLAISKAIVDAHAGTIAVSAASGAGTVFTVRIPACESGS